MKVSVVVFVTVKSLNIIQIFLCGMCSDAMVQCYDKAVTMSGKKFNVTTKIKSVNGKCLYIKYNGHHFILPVWDTIGTKANLKKLV